MIIIEVQRQSQQLLIKLFSSALRTDNGGGLLPVEQYKCHLLHFPTVTCKIEQCWSWQSYRTHTDELLYTYTVTILRCHTVVSMMSTPLTAVLLAYTVYSNSMTCLVLVCQLGSQFGAWHHVSGRYCASEELGGRGRGAEGDAGEGAGGSTRWGLAGDGWGEATD